MQEIPKKVETPQIFISHAWEDKELVRRLEAELTAIGAEVWVDYSRVRGGENLPEHISKALGWCNVLLLIWSESASKSAWVKREWTTVMFLDKIIIPCLMQNTPLPEILVSTAYVDFRNFNEGMTHLLEALRFTQSSAKKEIKNEEKTSIKQITAHSKKREAIFKINRNQIKKIAIFLSIIAVFASVFLLQRKIETQKSAMVDYLFLEANKLYVEKSFDKTVEILKQLLSIDPQHQQAKKIITAIEKHFQTVADSAYSNQQYWTAIANYQKAYDINRKDDIKEKVSQTQASKDSVRSLRLRSTGTTLLEHEIKAMLIKFNFYDSRWNAIAKGSRHVYEKIEGNGQKMVIDHTTGLTWQRSGSEKPVNYEQAKAYTNDLNEQNFGGYNDWRLPTLEEAISLVISKAETRHPKIDPDLLNGFQNIYIHSAFDRKQAWIWTEDKGKANMAWIAVFTIAICSQGDINKPIKAIYVRAVRSGH